MSPERQISPLTRLSQWKTERQETKRLKHSLQTAKRSLDDFSSSPCYDPLVIFRGDSPSVFDVRRLETGTVFRMTEYILPSTEEKYQWYVAGDRRGQMNDIFYVDPNNHESLTQTGLFLPDKDLSLVQCRINTPYFPVVFASEQIIVTDIPDEADSTEADDTRYLTKQIEIFSANSLRPRRV